MAKALTQAAISALKPGLQRIEVPDGGCRGLHLVVQPSGHSSWALRYRRDDKPAKLTLGGYPALSLKDARQKAVETQVAIGRGEDPGAARKAAREARKGNLDPAEADTVAAIAEAFIARHVEPKTRPKSAQETKRILRGEIVEAWGKRRLSDITRKDVHALVDRVYDRGSKVMANRVLAAIRRMCAWAVERDLIAASPCQGVRPPEPETSRERTLSDDELRRAWRAFFEMGQPFGPVFAIMTLTGQRESEVGGMTWDELDLGEMRPIGTVGLWRLPPGRVKNKQGHVVPLSPVAAAIIDAQPRIGAYVFTTTGRSPVSGWSRAKERLDRLAGNDGNDPWRLHDLRRTMATGCARLGIPPHVIEAALNHRSGQIRGVAAVYNRHQYLVERCIAMITWSKEIMILNEAK